jgi:hypothetical protein
VRGQGPGYLTPVDARHRRMSMAGWTTVLKTDRNETTTPDRA